MVTTKGIYEYVIARTKYIDAVFRQVLAEQFDQILIFGAGFEKGQIEQFLATYKLKLIDHKDAQELEKAYFSDSNGKVMGRVNGTHCLVTAEKSLP